MKKRKVQEIMKINVNRNILKSMKNNEKLKKKNMDMLLFRKMMKIKI